MKTLSDTYFNHVHPLAIALTAAQERGVLMDMKERARLTEVFGNKAKEKRARISELAGHEVNPNSPKQIAELLYDEMHLPVVYKGSGRTTEEEALLNLFRKYPSEEILRLIVEYRKDAKLVSTFLAAKLDADGAMHTSYNASGTGTYRISSSQNLWKEGMNLQNIPIGKRPGVENLRHLFISRPGMSFVVGDLVQAEAMVVARILCRHKCRYLYDRYKDPKFDIHKWAASTIFRCKESEIVKIQRDVGKIANHAGNYCSGPKVVMATATKWGVEGVDYQMAKSIVNSRREALPGLQRWWRSVEATLRGCRTLYTCLGRRRIFFGRVDDNATVRVAVAFEPQSTIGDVCNIIFRRMAKMLDFPNMPLLQVHDEVVVECMDELVSDVVEKMKGAAMVPLFLNDDMEPLMVPIDIRVGKNWRDLQ